MIVFGDGFVPTHRHMCCCVFYIRQYHFRVYTRVLSSSSVNEAVVVIVVVILMCIKRSMRMQLCIISACHKSQACDVRLYYTCIGVMYIPVVLSYARNKGLSLDENSGYFAQDYNFPTCFSEFQRHLNITILN